MRFPSSPKSVALWFGLGLVVLFLLDIFVKYIILTFFKKRELPTNQQLADIYVAFYPIFHNYSMLKPRADEIKDPVGKRVNRKKKGRLAVYMRRGLLMHAREGMQKPLSQATLKQGGNPFVFPMGEDYQQYIISFLYRRMYSLAQLDYFIPGKETHMTFLDRLLACRSQYKYDYHKLFRTIGLTEFAPGELPAKQFIAKLQDYQNKAASAPPFTDQDAPVIRLIYFGLQFTRWFEDFFVDMDDEDQNSQFVIVYRKIPAGYKLN